MLLGTADTSWMKAVQNTAMPDTAIIYRAGTAADGMGGITETWTATGTVSCRLDMMPMDRREAVTGGQIVSKSRWFVTMPGTADVLASDRIEINNRTFEVTFVNNDRSWRTALRAEVIAHNEEQRL